jgi:Na+-driven multidrug efflux pump
LFLFRTKVTPLFTKDEEVQQIIIQAVKVTAIVWLVDGSQGLLTGTVRALGK